MRRWPPANALATEARAPTRRKVTKPMGGAAEHHAQHVGLRDGFTQAPATAIASNGPAKSGLRGTTQTPWPAPRTTRRLQPQMEPRKAHLRHRPKPTMRSQQTGPC